MDFTAVRIKVKFSLSANDFDNKERKEDVHAGNHKRVRLRVFIEHNSQALEPRANKQSESQYVHLSQDGRKQKDSVTSRLSPHSS